MSLAGVKAQARQAALDRRAEAFRARRPDDAALLAEVLSGHRGRPLAGYAAMRTEIDPRPVLSEAARAGQVGMPVIVRKAAPLRFRGWTPESRMIPGTFGAPVPEAGAWIVPQVLIVPLLAFDRQGGRLGYGGGFYDRTLEALRAAGPVCAIGFAFSAQEMPGLPLEATDQPLDLIVTEREVIGSPGAEAAP